MRIIIQANGTVGFVGQLLAVITSTLQGLPNVLVYLYPMYQKRRREHPERGVLSWVKGALAQMTHTESGSLYPYSESRATPSEAANGEEAAGGQEDEKAECVGGASGMADLEEDSSRTGSCIAGQEDDSPRPTSFMAGQGDDYSTRRASRRADHEDDPSNHIHWVDQEEASP